MWFRIIAEDRKKYNLGPQREREREKRFRVKNWREIKTI